MPRRDQIDPTLQTYIDQINSDQTTFEAINGKYEQKLRGDIVDWVEVHEYVGPRGAGYIVFIWANEGQNEYLKKVHIGTDNWASQTDWALNVVEGV